MSCLSSRTTANIVLEIIENKMFDAIIDSMQLRAVLTTQPEAIQRWYRLSARCFQPLSCL